MGIILEFRDARGRQVRASACTLRQLIEAMGLPAADDQQVRDSHAALDREIWKRSVPPVEVVTAGSEPVVIDITLPAGSEEVHWQLDLEDGSTQSGAFNFTALEKVAERRTEEGPFERRRLTLHAQFPIGYHSFSLVPGAGRMTLIMAPATCWLPSFPPDERLWGVAAQLYLLRSDRNWGIGDFGDLAKLVDLVGDYGAGLIGLNPLHAGFNDDPEHASPYSPASRLLLNELYIDISRVPEAQTCTQVKHLIESQEFARSLQASQASKRVDYSVAARLKRQALEILFEACRTSSDQSRWHAFEEFKQRGGVTLQRSCLFLALREHFAGEQPPRPDWRSWPPEYRDHNSSAVRDFALQHSDAVSFLCWVQWVADEQLAAVQQAARRKGMPIGLYRDLAVGADRAGAETWTDPTAVVSDAHVGAPPDIFNPAGQDWGLPPFNPHALYRQGYAGFIELIRLNMRSAGGLRIDHAMALQQLYWIPRGESSAGGAYVQYPLDDLVGIIALESQRNQCIVVGEDLGTVPENFRERMSEAHILSYRVLLFEQDSSTGRFAAPADYPELSLAVSGSHDLPTLRGWWEGQDIELKEQLGLLPGTDEATRQRAARERDRTTLTQALRREGLIGATEKLDAEKLVRVANLYLARAKSLLAIVQLDDLLGERDPVNVPGTAAEYPNWRRRLSINLEDAASYPPFQELLSAFAAERNACK